MKKRLPEHMGPFRMAPVQNESVPRSIMPGQDTSGTTAFRRTLSQATSGQSQFDGLAYLVGTLWPNGCWGD